MPRMCIAMAPSSVRRLLYKLLGSSGLRFRGTETRKLHKSSPAPFRTFFSTGAATELSGAVVAIGFVDDEIPLLALDCVHSRVLNEKRWRAPEVETPGRHSSGARPRRAQSPPGEWVRGR